MDSINTQGILDLFTGQSIGNFFIKSFSIVFSLLFIIYSFIIYKQVQEISKTVQNSRNTFIIFVSLIQVFIGLALLLFAVFFV